MQGSVIAIAAAYALLLLLFFPIDVRVRAELSAWKGTCCVKVRVLLLPVSMRFAVHVLAPPCGTVDLVRRNGKCRRVLDVRASGGETPMAIGWILQLLRIRSIDVCWQVGAGARANAAALASGALCVLTEEAFGAFVPARKRRISAALLPGEDTVKIMIEGIAAPIPAEIIGGILRGSIKKREKRANGTSAGNHHAVHHGTVEKTG